MNARRSFFQYVIPSMLAFALSGVYAIADGFFVGNALGDNALAAINVAYPLTAFLQAVGTGIGMGGAIEYSIQIGKGNHQEARQYYGMALILLGIASVLLTLLYLAGASYILGLFGATGDIFTLGKEYLLYISFGAVFQIVGTGLVPLIRNMGGAVIAMAAMITGFLTNILLDYLFVWVFPWGMMGAAVATAIGHDFPGMCGFLRIQTAKTFSPFRKESSDLHPQNHRRGTVSVWTHLLPEHHLDSHQ